MAMQIGEMLVRAKVISPADLDEAVSWQVLYGGRLGTNILELGLCDEKSLAEALGRQLACEWTAGELELPESMVKLIPAVIARRQEIVPWRIEGKRFKVISIAPKENLALFDELGFKIGMIVKPVVAPEFRVHQALRRFYGSVRQMRAIDFGVKPKGKRAQEAERKAEQVALEKQADLMDDDAFAAIYAEVMAGRSANAEPTPPAPAPAPVPTPAPIPVATQVAAAPRPAPIEVARVAPPVLKPVQPAPPVVPAKPVPVAETELILTPIEEDEVLDAELLEEATGPIEGDEVVRGQWAAAFADLEQQALANEPPPAPPPELGALSFKEAVAEIGKAQHRDAVARAVLRYARSKAARAVLLNVQGDVALGWDAVGEDLTPEVARTIALPIGTPSVFKLVRESRSHYIGPIGKEAGNVRFLKLAGKKWPASAAIMPILFRGKVVYILYVDNGHKQQVDPDVGELLILSQNITRSMEQMVAKKQQQARG